MNKIKSERAKEIIEDIAIHQNCTSDDLHYILVKKKDIKNLIEIAEQDAEERAVAVFEQWGKTWLNSLPSHIREVATNSYKELLNGGQSDE